MRPHWTLLETPEQRAERLAQADAFWSRPEDELWRDLVLPEEDLPMSSRGGAHRWFRSENVIDLVKVRKVRAQHAAPGPPSSDGSAA